MNIILSALEEAENKWLLFPGRLESVRMAKRTVKEFRAFVQVSPAYS